VQPSPDGIAQAFVLGRDFIDGAPSTLILGGNIYFGHNLQGSLQEAAKQDDGATVFAYRVVDPERYGVVEFNFSYRALSIEEKPKKPKSHYAVTGLYFYDGDVCDIASEIHPSDRGELEITDVNMRYLANRKLNVKVLGRGYAWLDTGTHDSLLDASKYVATIEKRQGLKIAYPEEISFRSGWINTEQLGDLTAQLPENDYRQYLLQLLQERSP